jgi:hypothetical protein
MNIIQTNSLKLNRAINIFILLLPFTFILTGITYLLTSKDFSYNFYAEESYIEWYQAGFYFLASIIFFSLLRKKYNHKYHKLIILLFAIFFLLICIEEVSWGQKFFKFDTPSSFEKLNAQEETNLHNLEVFHKTGLIHIGYIIFTVGMLFSSYIAKSVKFYNLKDFVLPKILTIYFLIPAAFYIIIEFLYDLIFITYEGRHIPGPGDQEIFELILSLGCFLYALILRQKLSEKYTD